MKPQTAPERAIKTINHFQKEIAGSLSVTADAFAQIIERTVRYYAGDDEYCVIVRPSATTSDGPTEYGNASHVFIEDQDSRAAVFANIDFRFSDHNDGSFIHKNYHAWMIIPVAGKKETHLAVVIARKKGHFSDDETATAKNLGVFFSLALKDVRSRNRKISALADETAHRILLRTQSALGRKQPDYAGFCQTIDYSACTGSDTGQTWRNGEENFIACVCDVTADDIDRQIGLVYLDTWFSILAQTSLDMRGMLQRLNNDMVKRNTECYASIAAFRYSRTTGQAEVSGMGSAVAFFFSHDSMSVKSYTFGAASGIQRDLEIRSHLLAVKPGDILCLCTDGLTGTRKSNGDLFGTDDVAELIRRNYFLSSEDLASKILGTISGSAAPGVNTDDRTLQILKTS